MPLISPNHGSCLRPLVSLALLLAFGIEPGLGCGGATESTASVGSSGDSGATSLGTGTSTGPSTTGDSSGTGSSTGSTGEPEDPCEGQDLAGEGWIPWNRGQHRIDGCEVRGVRDYRAIIHLH
ncbi:MAG TPA: hypothetical protein ENJ18_01335, partial [Nannocystis exedens]|nr:hypothetical protein [Nannocystis exedens]